MTVAETLAQMANKFHGADIPDPKTEAILLLAHFLKMTRSQLFLAANQSLTPQQHAQLAVLMQRRMQREPLAYIIGEQEFWSLPFLVTRDVLIPRPETELLAEKAIARTKRRHSVFHGPILDLGCGSGVLAIVLARELPDARIVAVDRSLAALRVALENGRRHQVEDRVLWLNAHWTEAFQEMPYFDLVVANPPYIDPEILPSLEPEVRDHEPRLALDGGHAGVAVIQEVLAAVSRILRPGGWFFMEIGSDQGEYVKALAENDGEFTEVTIHQDYSGLARILETRKKTWIH